MPPVYKSFVKRFSKHRMKKNEDNVEQGSKGEQDLDSTLFSHDNSSSNRLQDVSEIHQLEMQALLGLLYEPGDNQLYLKTALEATRKAKRYMDQALTDGKEHVSSLQDALKTGAFVAGALAGGKEMIGSELKNFSSAGAKKYISREKDRILKDNAAQPQFAKNVTTAAESLVGIVTKLDGVISNLLPQSPEYTVPYGFVMIIFKAWTLQSILAKRRKQEDAVRILDSLEEKLPTISLMQLMYPIVKMKILIADIYINILDLLQQIANYLSSNPIIKLLDATFALERYDFNIYLSPIDRAKGKIEELFQLCHVADNKSMKITTDRTGIVVSSIYDDLGGLSKIVGNLEIAQIKRERFSAGNLVSNLIDIWEHSIAEPADELELWKGLKFYISAKDHWTVNGILPKISEWQRSHSDSILWISSPYLARDSWLTQFSLDLIYASQAEGHHVTFAMCDRPQHSLTFLSLTKQLICQGIYDHPETVLEAPFLFNPRTFNKATTIEKALCIFRGLIEQLDSLLVVIDRIDLCNREEQPGDWLEMIQHLSILAKARPGVLKIIITCGEEIPDDTFANVSVSIIKVNLKKKKRQKKKTDFLLGRQINVRTDPTRPTYTRFARKWLSITTLRQHYIDFEIDKDPEYLLVKRWVPEFEQDILWSHTKKMREEAVWTKMPRKHLSLTTLHKLHIDYQADDDEDFVFIKRWVPEVEQDKLFEHTRRIRHNRFKNKIVVPGKEEGGKHDSIA